MKFIALGTNGQNGVGEVYERQLLAAIVLIKDCRRGPITKSDDVVDINACSGAQLRMPKTVN